MTLFGWDAGDFDHDRRMRAAHIETAARDAGIPFLGVYARTR